MSRFASAPVAAVLGPTNTGKTYLAIERLCGHSSGMIGFPLRLLAREVYDRVVAIKGPSEVALITGEERILPGARWFLCTASFIVSPGDEDSAQGVTIQSEGSAWNLLSPASTPMATLRGQGQSGAPVVARIQVLSSQEDTF